MLNIYTWENIKAKFHKKIGGNIANSHKYNARVTGKNI